MYLESINGQAWIRFKARVAQALSLKASGEEGR